MSFYDSNYKGPIVGGGSYIKLEDGKNTFRFMSDVLTFNRYWLKDSEGKERPFRYDSPKEIPAEASKNQQGKARTNHVWAVVAIRKDDKGKPESIGILELSQATIQKALMAYYNEEDYGDFSNYDITITKSGSGLDTTYQIIAKAPKAVAEPELQMYEGFEYHDLPAHYSKDSYNNKDAIDAALEEPKVSDKSLDDLTKEIDGTLPTEEDWS